MVIAGGINERENAAAREPPPPPPPPASGDAQDQLVVAPLDPRLFMAARRGDSKQIKDLLLLDDEEEEPADPPLVEAAQEVIVVHVDDSRSSSASAAAPAPAPAPLQVVLDGGGVTTDGDSLLHVVAACGDGEEFIKCAKMIVRDKERKGGAAAKRQVLEARNSNGNTPLHCAASAGNAEMISCLVALANTADGKALVRMRNQCGETSMHQAIRAASANNHDRAVVCIDRLMSVDPDLPCCIPPEGEEGASPLYLAISLGDLEIAEHLLVKTEGRLSYAGPDGQNVLHAAASCGPGKPSFDAVNDTTMQRRQTTETVDPHQVHAALPMLLKWLKRLKTAAAQGDQRRMSGSSEPADLLWQLTSQRDRLDGSTPLHLAASNVRPWDWLLCRLFPWSGSAWPAVAVLLDANVSTAYQADNEGSYPVHVAARSCHLGVVKLLLEWCPDSASLRDGKGRTFLHVAVEVECQDVVRYVCGMVPQFASILNAQDKKGDTPLHRAVHAGNVAIFRYLIRNRQVRLDVANKDGMTPLDLAWSLNPPGFQYGLNPRGIIEKTLAYVGAPHGSVRPQLMYEKYISKKRDVDGESEKHTQAAQVMSIVTVLIATVTFASAFTLPGGFRAEGTPVLAGRSYAFDAFILADTLAFVCSIGSTFCLVYAGLPAMDISIRGYYFNLSVLLLQNAARSSMAAFGLCFYLVLAPVDRMVAVAVCVIIFASLLWGNMGAWQITCLAITVHARAGIRPYALRTFTQAISSRVKIYFGSFIIIFGLPAIRKWARSAK